MKSALERIREMAPEKYQGDLLKSRTVLAKDHAFLLRAFKVMKSIAHACNEGIPSYLSIEREFEKRMAE